VSKLFPLRRSLPLYTAASSRVIEAQASALPLMERAGLAIAKLALALQPQGPIWIVCGPGNNGGDGLVAARRLQVSGHAVSVSLVDADKHAPAEAQQALRAAQEAGVAINRGLLAPAQAGLVIDALLGLGLSREPSTAMAVAIDAINAQAAPVLAVDLPSGLLADSGALAGTTAVHAQHTLALLTLKPGLLTGLGRAQCGALWFDALGVDSGHAPDALALGSDGLSAFQQSRSPASHKGSHGDVVILGGAPGMRGAPLLAARAALAAGAGRVYASLLGDPVAEVDAGRPELMRWPGGANWGGRTVVAGCGGGQQINACLPSVLQLADRLVLDADALNAIANDGALRKQLIQRSQPTVLTPHPLEAARLLGSSTAAVQADRLGAAQTLAEQLGGVVVLKGSGSVIAAPGSIARINGSGSAALATAGTGDVLAGWLGGLWAQHPSADVHALACAAVCWHGLGGETQAAGPLRAADLIERMHALHHP